MRAVAIKSSARARWMVKIGGPAFAGTPTRATAWPPVGGPDPVFPRGQAQLLERHLLRYTQQHYLLAAPMRLRLVTA